MHRAGKHKFKPYLHPDKDVTAVEGIAIKNKDVERYCDDFYYSCLRAYNMTKMWGLANGTEVGWANEPMDYINAITVLETISNEVEREETEARMEESKQKAALAKTRKRR